MLRRIWLSEEEERRYYNGFANEGLWPLAHTVHVRPRFRSEDWDGLSPRQRALCGGGRGGAQRAGRSRSSSRTIIWRWSRRTSAARAARAHRVLLAHPVAASGSAAHLSVAARDHEGPAGQRSARVPARARSPQFPAARAGRARRRRSITAPVEFEGHTTRVIAAPIGVDFDRIDRIAARPGLQTEVAELFREERLDDPAIDSDRRQRRSPRLHQRHSRAARRHRSAADQASGASQHARVRAGRRAVAIDGRGATRRSNGGRRARRRDQHAARQGPGLGPIRYRKSALKLRPLVALYRLADFCVVSSLHDGMNLVAKEFVAAREDLGGVLVLSEMTGAAQELTDAVLMNPYHVDGFAQAHRRRDRHVADGADAPHALASAGRLGAERVPLGHAHPRSPRRSVAGRRHHTAAQRCRRASRRLRPDCRERVECPRLTCSWPPSAFAVAPPGGTWCCSATSTAL